MLFWNIMKAGRVRDIKLNEKLNIFGDNFVFNWLGPIILIAILIFVELGVKRKLVPNFVVLN